MADLLLLYVRTYIIFDKLIAFSTKCPFGLMSVDIFFIRPIGRHSSKEEISCYKSRSQNPEAVNVADKANFCAVI